MTNRPDTPPRAPVLTIETVRSEYGTPEPSIRIDLGAGTHFRRTHAAIHIVTARAERLSGKDRSCVQTKAHAGHEHKGPCLPRTRDRQRRGGHARARGVARGGG